MKIKKMTAVFGALNGKSLELNDGLNIIYAPNESGKSTWCAFIRAMLYGIDSSQREKGGVKPDKLRYAPWTGEPVSGEMEIEHDGKLITLTRRSKTSAAPMRDFAAFYTGTAQKVDFLSGTDAGLSLTGMSRTVFDSSVFVRQSGLGVSNSAELEKRIGSIVSTGEDSGGTFTAADEILRAWLRKRRFNRSGAIPALDGEIAEARRLLSELESSVRLRTDLEKRLAAAKNRESLAAREAGLSTENRRAELLAQIESRRGDLARAEEKCTLARERAISLKAAAEKGPFAGKSAGEAKKAAAEDGETLRALRSAVPGRQTFVILAVAAVLTVPAAIILKLPLLFISTVLLGGAALAAAFLRRGREKEFEAFALAMLHRYGVKEEQQIAALAESYAADEAAWRRAESEKESARLELVKCREALFAAEREMLTSADKPSGTQALDLARSETVIAERSLAQAEGRLQALGDPMVAETKLGELEQRKKELQEQYDALSLAISVLREANDELQQRFSPRLSAKAGELMQRLTGGKYDRLTFDRQLNAMARRTGDAGDHELDLLSSGAADQLYLALRLAICELALPEGFSCPLILDDALVNFDDERMGKALDMLSEIAEERQVILFTCHDRELRYMEQK